MLYCRLLTYYFVREKWGDKNTCFFPYSIITQLEYIIVSILKSHTPGVRYKSFKMVNLSLFYNPNYKTGASFGSAIGQRPWRETCSLPGAENCMEGCDYVHRCCGSWVFFFNRTAFAVFNGRTISRNQFPV